ncbi:MAG: hypothetical protein JWP09_222 [Candidatus Taylorbacteria bacterium]|nr:hypothetical protein [Candidatus Taylorbacteria bacterium]
MSPRACREVSTGTSDTFFAPQDLRNRLRLRECISNTRCERFEESEGNTGAVVAWFRFKHLLDSQVSRIEKNYSSHGISFSLTQESDGILKLRVWKAF